MSLTFPNSQIRGRSRKSFPSHRRATAGVFFADAGLFVYFLYDVFEVISKPP